MNLEPIFLSFQLALVTSFLLLIICVPLAYWLAFGHSKYKFLVEAIVSMPLVLPPTVLGFYLLLFFAEVNSWFEVQFAFSFSGLVLASMIYSFAFMVQPLQAGFESLNYEIREASFTLGKSAPVTLVKVLLPMIKPSLLTALVLCFAHTLGEFGVVLMVGGSIPGVTKVASIAIYEEVESLNYHQAHMYSAILVALSFLILVATYLINGRARRSKLA